MANNNLTVIDGETLADMRLPPAQYCVKSLLHQGVTILGGAPKIGKSWMVLDLCVRVAKGESVFGLEVRQGTTLYLCLEDTLRRIQHRLVSLTDEAPANMFFSTEARTLTEGLCDQVREFVRAHPDTILVAVDTFQVIRSTTPDVSYATDYQDVRELKKLADELGISILLVHHLRKQGAADPLNKLSGTTGIAGAVDAVLVLEKSDRCQSGAALICTGRDIEYRELELRFLNSECSWELVSDSAEDPAMLLPPELGDLVEFMRVERHFSGSNTELAERYNVHTGRDLTAKKLKQLMNKWRYELEAQGLVFESRRSNGQRFVEVSFSALGSDASDSSDATSGALIPCGTCVPCDPVAAHEAAGAELLREVAS